MSGGRDGPQPGSATGRRPVTSRAQLEHIGLRLFTDDGFEATTVDRIAGQAGISRRTFFRYFDSKNDLPWGDFDVRLGRLGERLRSTPAGRSVGDAVAESVIESNAVLPGDDLWHRQRMSLLLHVPALQAHGTLRYRDWRQVVAGFVAERRGELVDDLVPRTAGYLALGAALAAYEQWLTDESLGLDELMRQAFVLFRRSIPDVSGPGGDAR